MSAAQEVLPDEQVAVVVVMYHSAALLPDLVASLASGMAGVGYELVAVDNDSPDDSAAVIQGLVPDVTLVRTGRNGGYAAGINAGVAAAGPHTAVLVVNSDVRLQPGCAVELLRGLRKPGVGVAVPRLLNSDGQLIDSMRREPSVGRAVVDAVIGARKAGSLGRVGEIVTDWDAYEREQQTDWAEGSTQLVSAGCWEACGPWDESFFLYSEETEFDLRARDRGFATLYVPTAHAVHLESGSGVSHGLWVLQVLNRVRLFRRRNGRAATAAYWSALLLREATRAAMGRSNSRAAVRALLDRDSLRLVPGPEMVKAWT